MQQGNLSVPGRLWGGDLKDRGRGQQLWSPGEETGPGGRLFKLEKGLSNIP